MNIETFKRFVKPGQVFAFNAWNERGLHAARLVAFHNDCIETVDRDGDTTLYPNKVFDSGVRIAFGADLTKRFEAGSDSPLRSLLDSLSDGSDEREPALTPDEIERLTASVD